MNSILNYDLLCFSHLRWEFVFQRPQHLMTRFCQNSKVFFLEEPIFDCLDGPYLQNEKKLPGLWVLTPHLPAGISQAVMIEMMTMLLDSFFGNRNPANFIFWYYTPVALDFSGSYKPALTVYDCMDELAAFKFAPPQIKYMEQQLLIKADIVFTGGISLFEAKRESHHNIYPFPSSIDKAHFQAARYGLSEPADQQALKGIKLGFYGVIDERFDQGLIRQMAAKRPDWHLILIGPVVKIDPATLPIADNIHYLGCKSYQELPAYLSGWDVALIPFLLNESTRFISPTKTPEYLAAGKPVVSSAIRDVVEPYGKMKLVSIGHDVDSFIEAVEYELNNLANPQWLTAVDKYLEDKSWQATYDAMRQLMEATAKNKNALILTSDLKKAS